MKLIKIAQDHYVIVDDSEIKKGDYWFDGTNIRNDYSKQIIKSFDKKITHSTRPLETLKKEYAWYGGDNKVKQKDFSKIISICLQEVKELIGEMDVEKRFWDILNSETSQSRDEMLLEATKHGFKYGYNQALEDNKGKVYTEEDLFNAIGVAIGLWSPTYASFEEGWKLKILQSLQPKTEWEVEFVDGKLALKK